MRASAPDRRTVCALALLAVAAAAYLHVDPGNPPGFYRDEAGIALDAALVAETGRDYTGNRLPLYFESYGDWKSGPYHYLLAAVFLVTGPDETAARLLSGALGLTAVALLGLLGLRLSGSRAVGVATALLAACTPWLFELSRLVFEVALVPALVAALLLLLAQAGDRDRWPLPLCLAVGLVLALIAYSYAAGRALAPLLAMGLLVFARRGRRRSVALALAAAGVALLPMAAFVVARPGALLARYYQAGQDADGGPLQFVTGVAADLAVELNLLWWAVAGDANARHHVVGGGGSLLLAGVLLALVGAAVVVSRRRWDAYWTYVALGVPAAAVPAAIADVRVHALRSAALPVFLLVLAVPALAAAHERLAEVRVRRAAVAAAALVAVQVVAFAVAWAVRGPDRRDAFHADLVPVLQAAHRAGPVVVGRDDTDPYGGALWRALLDDRRVGVLEQGQDPPPGSVLVLTERTCDGCELVLRRGWFAAYRVPG